MYAELGFHHFIHSQFRKNSAATLILNLCRMYSRYIMLHTSPTIEIHGLHMFVYLFAAIHGHALINPIPIPFQTEIDAKS